MTQTKSLDLANVNSNTLLFVYKLRARFDSGMKGALGTRPDKSTSNCILTFA